MALALPRATTGLGTDVDFDADSDSAKKKWGQMWRRIMQSRKLRQDMVVSGRAKKHRKEGTDRSTERRGLVVSEKTLSRQWKQGTVEYGTEFGSSESMQRRDEWEWDGFK
eukprot:515122-Rhodomonas_salina.1